MNGAITTLDSSFVGTAFVNATANLLVTMGKNVQLSLGKRVVLQ
jgi:hypothetical protein